VDVARNDEADARAARWEREAHDLSTQVAYLQEELALARRKVSEGPRHVRQLEERLAATSAQVARLTENNERLVATLKEARAQIVTLKEEIDRLAQPPSGYGIFLSQHDDESVDVFTAGRKMRVALSPSVEADKLRRGQEVLLNDALNVVSALEFERAGEVAMVKEILEGGDRALVISHADEERVVHLAHTLLDAPLLVDVHRRRERDSHLATGGEHVDGLVVVLGEEHAIATGGLGQPIDLLLERDDLGAGLLEGGD
jgi:proteasome-associated ATPase